MFGRSITASILSLLVLIRLIPADPGRKFRLFNFCGTIIWTIVLAGLYISHAVYVLPEFVSQADKTVPGFFNILTYIVFPGFQIVAFVPCLAYIGFRCPGFVEDKMLAQPRHCVLYIVGAGLYVAYPLSIIYYLDMFSPTQASRLRAVMDALFLGFWTGSMMLSTTIIGSSLNQFHKKLQAAAKTSTSIKVFEDITTDFKALKSGLSPLLFVTFSTKCVVLINDMMGLALGTGTKEAAPSAILIISTLSQFYDLIYITYLVDEAYANFKDLANHLR